MTICILKQKLAAPTLIGGVVVMEQSWFTDYEVSMTEAPWEGLKGRSGGSIDGDYHRFRDDRCRRRQMTIATVTAIAFPGGGSDEGC